MPADPSFMATFPGLILLGALLNLDKQACGPFMLGRPLVTGLVLGLASGEVRFGIWLGLSAELLWLAVLPLGGQLTPHASLAVSAAFIAWVKSGLAAPPAPEPTGEALKATLVIAFLTVPVWAKVMGLIDLGGRRLVPGVLARTRAALAEGREPHFLRRNLGGLAITLVLSIAVLTLAAFLNLQFLRVVASFTPQALFLNLGFIFHLLPFAGLLGVAVFLDSKAFPFYLGGLAASLLALSAV